MNDTDSEKGASKDFGYNIWEDINNVVGQVEIKYEQEEDIEMFFLATIRTWILDRARWAELEDDPMFKLLDEHTSEYPYNFHPDAYNRIWQRIYEIVWEITDKDNKWMVAHSSTFLRKIGFDEEVIRGFSIGSQADDIASDD